MDCYLYSVEIKNHKSIKHAKVTPNEGLSVFIGKNGAGKTVFMNAIRLLEKLNKRSYYYQDSTEKPDEEDYTTLIAIFNVSGTLITYESTFYEEEKDQDRSEFKIRSEHVSIKGFKRNKRIEVPFISLLQLHTGNGFRIYSSSAAQKARDAFRNIDSFSNYKEHFAKINAFINGIKYYSATKYSSPQSCPSVIELDEKGRQNVTAYSHRLGHHHERFLTDLYFLYSKNKELWEIYKSTVGSSVLDLVDDIQFSELDLPSFSYKVTRGGKIQKSESKRKIVAPVFFKGSLELSPSKLSEGTFKTLAMIFYILTDQGAISLVEEPEVCVHHGLLSKIIDIIKSYSYEKQIFITTHSEVVLDSVEPESIFVILWKDGSEISKLTDFLGAKGVKNLKTYLKDQGNLGEYIKHKDILDE